MSFFNLIFTLGANRKPLQDGLKGAEKDVSHFASRLKSMLAGALSISMARAYTQHLAETVGQIKDLADQSGLTTDEIQNFDHALKQSGFSVETLIGLLNRLGNARREAIESGDPGAFAAFGIGMDDLTSGQRNVDLMLKLGDAMKGTTLSAHQQGEVMALLGVKAGNLTEALKGLREAQAPIRYSAHEVEQFDATAKSVSTGAKTADTFFGKVFGSVAAGWRELISRSWGAVMGESGTHAAIPLPEVDPTVDRARARAAEWVGPRLPKDWKSPEQAAVMSSISPNHWRQAPSDSLVSVGNFLGGDPTASMRGTVKQIQTRLDQMEKHLHKLANGALVIRK
jgi:hypothetical protein